MGALPFFRVSALCHASVFQLSSAGLSLRASFAMAEEGADFSPSRSRSPPERGASVDLQASDDES
eukprot:6884155-Alexandrium_andersonii.AAC.1